MPKEVNMSRRQQKIKIIKDENQSDASTINVLALSFHDDIQAISRKKFSNQEQRNKNIPKVVVEKVKNCIEEKVRAIDCKLSHDRDAIKHLNYHIRSAIAEYYAKNEAFLTLVVENLEQSVEDEMEWSPSQESVNPAFVSIEEFESLKKELLETKAKEKYWRERCEKAEKEAESLKKLRSGMKERQNQVDRIGSEVIRIFDRVERGAVGPEMTELLISWMTKAQQSTRQIRKFLEH